MDWHFDDLKVADQVYTTDGLLGYITYVERIIHIFDYGMEDRYIVVRTEHDAGEDLYIPVKYITAVDPALHRVDLSLARADLTGEIWRRSPHEIDVA
ncbi:MAG: hypothetical protein HY689_07000 [Chloroflexi bacterium]|nr:hypothetical protein [Chloroflexota bacterium]